eukprot:scaffold89443_cov14-Tisochrysis_lutea.AAC.2
MKRSECDFAGALLRCRDPSMQAARVSVVPGASKRQCCAIMITSVPPLLTSIGRAALTRSIRLAALDPSGSAAPS